MTIAFSNFSFRYESLDKPTLKNINLRIEKGEKIVIIGPSGSGKSTLGQCLNGLIPHAIKGEVTGSLEINGKNISDFSMHDYTEQVGTVLQDTDSQFVGLSIGEDIAFALENQLVSNIDMYPLVKSTAKMVDLADMLDRSPHDLSGGQKQRVSLAGILVDDVDILLFDEPLASLDPKTGKATIEIIDQLHKETNKTIVIIEHRLEDVLHRDIDRVILMERGEVVADMTPDEILASELLETHGIREPLYLSTLKAAKAPLTSDDKLSNLKALDYKRFRPAVQAWFAERPTPVAEKQYQPLLEVHGLTYSYDGEKNALEDVSFKIGKGEFVSILGKNGSGKSTITKIIMGVIDADSGSSYLNGEDLSELSIFERSQRVGVVMQNPNHMISHHMIFDEVAFGLRNRGVTEQEIKEKVENVLELCGLSKFRHWPIEALSYGQKKRVTIASILVLEPELLILDEPTAGQDYRNYTSMLAFIQKLNRELGITVVIISHDMHLVLEYTTRSIVIADSKLIANAAMTEVFSQPSLLERANLCTTSIYELATMMKIDDTNAFMQYFIDYERSSL
ncbi:Duplicated ATPase component MtsB of energizing module of methionine-regulated ECF transporter [Vibrio chagasii]|uniref:ABC transporter ATP-binding protein n=1 Tax=Vibrio chagasii TaxID=170679 RepID=UPI0033707D60|nr:Duplicated ATPase component MtsB of energizing module of methionine-regulated ECF transporter [Vibrio chagasii]CAH7225225.1 Duplicated ATPase component MtsB of energizing module of methionine-regulated ECF transporter [Vibrio chagasii]CAH7252137.1 Duplicated ATPase component MtsB of energizing module of methionine-regulated ECF transporter [Vibrio chagasii]CAH7443586.1 Duplicated ATPase component MtsB of energizing module of methionine-regulated ECF transporter [Vibrio chagasii]